MKQYILLLVLMVMGAGMTVHAEDVNPVKVGNVISGHIIEKGTEASLPYATILIVETGQGTVSDENGEFVFKKIPAGKYTLRVQFIIRKSKFPQNPKRSVRFSGKGTKRSVQKRKARNTQKAETKVL